MNLLFRTQLDLLKKIQCVFFESSFQNTLTYNKQKLQGVAAEGKDLGTGNQKVWFPAPALQQLIDLFLKVTFQTADSETTHGCYGRKKMCMAMAELEAWRATAHRCWAQAPPGTPF